MTATPLQSPYCQFFDSNGDPLSGGLVYTYSAGTTTPKNSYTSYTGITPNTNPVILDSSGRAEIWCVGTYRIDVKTSMGVLVRSVDNLPAVNTGGDMTAAIYDPANVAQQLVGLTAVQSPTNKSFNSTNTATTQTAGDNSTKLATTAYADTAGNGVLQASNLVKTSDTTFADIPGMSFACGIGNYSLRVYGRVDQLAAGGHKLQNTFSGTLSGLFGFANVYNSGTASPLSSTVLAGTGAIENSTTGTVNIVFLDFILNVSVAGSFVLQGAQQASNGTATTFSSFTAKLTKLS